MKNANEYFDEKMNMLSELLASSEDIMSNINNDNWEEYALLADTRRAIIDKLDAFEDSFRLSYDPELSPKQRSAINSQVQLIQNFDSDIVKKLEEEKIATLKAMNASKQERNIFDGYKKAEVPASGTFFDIKK